MTQYIEQYDAYASQVSTWATLKNMSVGGTFTAVGAANFSGAVGITGLLTLGSMTTGGAVSALGDTLTVTQALHAGRVIGFGKTSGTICTLPASSGSGDVYTFVIVVAATSNANIIKVANATDVMGGSLALQQDVDAAGTLKLWQAATTDDTITLAGAATTGGIKGGFIRCTDYASGFWSCQLWTSSGGGSEATPFSATVS